MKIKSNKQHLTIRLSGHNAPALRAYIMYLSYLFGCARLHASIAYLPNTSKKFTLIRSPHVNKKSKEQFCLNSFQCVIKVPFVQPGYIPVCLNYILSNRPSGIKVRLNVN